MKKDNEARLKCGLAFEDLTMDEMYAIDGGGSSSSAPTSVLSTTTLPCVSVSLVASAGITLVVTVVAG